MKWMIASDLHGSYYYAQQLQQAFEREQADRLLFLGDLLYHGPRNDLPRDYAPKQVIPLLNSLAPKLLCVRGNCDAEVDQMVLNFPVLADYAVLPVGQRLARQALHHVYGQALASDPPQVWHVEKRDEELRIRFSDCAGGLRLRPGSTPIRTGTHPSKKKKLTIIMLAIRVKARIKPPS